MSKKDADFAALVAQAKDDLSEANLSVARFHARRRKFWQDVFGSDLDGLLRDRSLAEARLVDPNPTARIATLDILEHHWGPDEHLGDLCEKLAIADLDPQVRNVAVGVYCSCKADGGDRDCQRKLAEIVKDAAHPNKFRAAAYLGLLRVAGRPLETWPDPTTFQFPGQVDWQIVDAAVTPVVHPSLKSA